MNNKVVHLLPSKLGARHLSSILTRQARIVLHVHLPGKFFFFVVFFFRGQVLASKLMPMPAVLSGYWVSSFAENFETNQIKSKPVNSYLQQNLLENTTPVKMLCSIEHVQHLHQATSASHAAPLGTHTPLAINWPPMAGAMTRGQRLDSGIGWMTCTRKQKYTKMHWMNKQKIIYSSISLLLCKNEIDVVGCRGELFITC